MQIDRIHKQDQNYYLDAFFLELQEHLGIKLPWLNHIFGKSQLMRTSQPNSKKYPGILISTRQGYENLLPNSELGNFSFVKVDDPQSVDTADANKIKFNGSIIFWLDLRKIDKKTALYSKELLKSEILKAVQTTRFSSGRLRVNKMLEQAQNIYNGYDYSETDDQFLMAPYFGLKLECSMEYTEICQ